MAPCGCLRLVLGRERVIFHRFRRVTVGTPGSCVAKRHEKRCSRLRFGRQPARSAQDVVENPIRGARRPPFVGWGEANSHPVNVSAIDMAIKAVKSGRTPHLRDLPGHRDSEPLGYIRRPRHRTGRPPCAMSRYWWRRTLPSDCGSHPHSRGGGGGQLPLRCSTSVSAIFGIVFRASQSLVARASGQSDWGLFRIPYRRRSSCGVARTSPAQHRGHRSWAHH